MATHSDPTANAAIGAVGREWKRMVDRAIRLRQTGQNLAPEDRKSFIGIYRRLLTAAPDELEKLKRG